MSKIEIDVVTGEKDPQANYTMASLVLHWLAAVTVLALFVFHEDGFIPFHVGLGMVAALPLLYRVWWRFKRGFARPPQQHHLLNFLARLVMIGMLACIAVLVVTGVLLPASGRGTYDLFGLWSFNVQLGLGRGFHEALETIHDVAGHLIVPLFGLHLVGFIKHRFVDTHGNKNRMLRPMSGGR